MPHDDEPVLVRTRCFRAAHTDGEHAWNPETAALLDSR